MKRGSYSNNISKRIKWLEKNKGWGVDRLFLIYTSDVPSKFKLLAVKPASWFNSSITSRRQSAVNLEIYFEKHPSRPTWKLHALFPSGKKQSWLQCTFRFPLAVKLVDVHQQRGPTTDRYTPEWQCRLEEPRPGLSSGWSLRTVSPDWLALIPPPLEVVREYSDDDISYWG